MSDESRRSGSIWRVTRDEGGVGRGGVGNTPLRVVVMRGGVGGTGECGLRW